MDDRDINIDIVFRNGLKDYEVLPPNDVWDNIQPAIRKNKRPLVILRAAAMFAVMIALSFLAYRYSREIPSGLKGPVMALNPESFAPENDAVIKTLPAREISQNQILTPDIPYQENKLVVPVTTDNIASPEEGIVKTAEIDKMAEEQNDPPALIALDYKTDDYIDFSKANTLEVPENTGRKIPDRWSISALISPTYQSRFTSGENEAVTQAMASEQPIMSYSGGLALSYKVNKRFSIQSGLYYSNIGKELTGIAAYSGFSDHFYTKGSPNFVITTSNGNV
jgi:hypothetical protein